MSVTVTLASPSQILVVLIIVSVVGMAGWPVILAGWPVGVVSQPAADAERYRCACWAW